jgi:hypothetical protein
MDLNDTTNRVIAGIVLALIFIGGWWLIAQNTRGIMQSGEKSGSMADAGGTGASSGSSSAGSSSGSGSSTGMEGQMVSGEGVTVADQPAGSLVTVKSARLDTTGWLAVRDSRGWILGAARLEAGVHEAVEVPLLRSTTAGESYQVLLYADDGDKTFDFKKDALVMNSDGSVVGTTFSAVSGD